MPNFKEAVSHYDAIVASCQGIERKGKTVPYTSANGYMFSLVNKDGEIGMRFDKDRQAKLIEELNSSLFKSHGATMRGYVLIPEALWSDVDRCKALLQESYDHVMTLEPK